jgi:AcrR family transcriptional regulator
MILDAARDVFLESGFNGARLRDVADRVGITQAYLYQLFASKNELYQAAVHEPIDRAIEAFTAELEALVGTPEMTSIGLVQGLNEIMLRLLVRAVPYLGVALFSDLESGRALYRAKIHPQVHDPLVFLVRSIKGWPAPGIDPTIVVNAMWGLNYGVALEASLRGRTVDVKKTAERITRLYAVGIPEFKRSPGVRDAAERTAAGKRR